MVLLGVLGLALTVTARAQTATACPPQAQPPSPQQLQAAAAQARDRGLLWRLTRDGRTSYLYGTIHIGRLDWAFPGEQVRAALMASDTLALEIDVGDPQMAARMQPPADSVVPSLAPALRERLDRQIDAACVPKALLASQHPVMQVLTLMVLAARWQGLDPGYAQEFVLSRIARAAQRRVVSLESPESQMAVLLPAEPHRAQAMLAQQLDQLEDGRVRRQILLLGGVWERGDLEQLERHESWCECVQDDEDRAFMRRVNDERNPGLADRIDALHREDRRVFAAVGALHLSGPKALPALLRARGYEVERIPFPP
jgi:uncharacterized protein YbaP (TraB family)